MVAEGTVPPNQPATDPGRNMPGVDGNHASLNDVGKNIGAAYAHALTYVSAQADRLKIAIRNAILFSVIGIVGIVFLLGLLITATVLLLHGVAGGISSGLGIRPWAGDVITGGGLLRELR